MGRPGVSKYIQYADLERAVKVAFASAPQGLERSIFVASLQPKESGTLAPELQDAWGGAVGRPGVSKYIQYTNL